MGSMVRKFVVALVGLGSLALMPAAVDAGTEAQADESTTTVEATTTTVAHSTTTSTTDPYPPPPPPSLPATGGGESAGTMLTFAALAIGLGLIAVVAARRRTAA